MVCGLFFVLFLVFYFLELLQCIIADSPLFSVKNISSCKITLDSRGQKSNSCFAENNFFLFRYI
ncbi:MAG: hypothetical protein D3906_08435, partial [Candidatus Electrothrix sp. AUS1_2]|nr:hypothetical protein [Candidatus Electrothrix sp. AUS1_2]